jgi:hypothetical protein
MEKVSTINYKGKNILYANYGPIGKDKNKVYELMASVDEAYKNSPPHSVLALIDVANIEFDMDILKRFKEAQSLYEVNQKKVAIIGVKGLLKAGYNFVIGLTANKTTKAFDTELEAKEWLVSD